MDVTDGADAEAVKAASEDTDVHFDPWAKNGWLSPAEVKEKVRENNKYFKHVKINSSAAAKMLEHAQHGVEKGRKRSGMPIEIAGLLIGKIRKGTFVVFDTLPLPVEGTESQVVASDGAAIEHPFRAMPYVEARGMSFIGWYHSHPFDLQSNPHWFMSGIDCQSQTLFQSAYNGAWVAIVVDPIRSLHRQTLELGSFYCYPPEYNPPSKEGPDGMINDQETIHDRWGNAFKRYYLLESDFFMSNTVKSNLRHVFDDWKQCFSQELRRDENQQPYDVARLRTLASSLDPASSKGSGGFGRSKIDEGLNVGKSFNSRICQYECRCRGYAQMIKHLIFNINLDDGVCEEVVDAA